MQHRRHAACPGERGLTLIEMLVTLAIAVILMGVAIPAYSRLHATWQRDSATRLLLTHLQLARSEAIKRSRRVVVCNRAPDDSLACAPTGDQEWKRGWVVFQDDNHDGALGPGEAVIASAGALPGIQAMHTNGQVRRFVYLPNGLMVAGMSTLSITPSARIDSQKVIINRTGRVRLTASD